jgi:hypothetical protein
MSGLNQDAAEYNRLSSLALQAERNAYRGLPVSQEQAAAKQYIDQQQQDMALGFTGSIKPASAKNINYQTDKVLVDIPIDKIMHGESIMPGGKLTWPGSKELVKEYANKKTDFPPIEVVSSDASIPWMVADGSHRLEAAKLRGNKTIKAYVSPFDKEGLELIKKK